MLLSQPQIAGLLAAFTGKPLTFCFELQVRDQREIAVEGQDDEALLVGSLQIKQMGSLQMAKRPCPSKAPRSFSVCFPIWQVAVSPKILTLCLYIICCCIAFAGLECVCDCDSSVVGLAQHRSPGLHSRRAHNPSASLWCVCFLRFFRFFVDSLLSCRFVDLHNIDT